MMGGAHSPRLRLLATALPFAFVAHVLEEAPRFVEWFNSLVTPGISQQSFLYVNAVAFLITLVLAVMVVSSTQSGLSVVAVAWVGFLMLANGILHLVGTIALSRYSPGVVTGALVYLPLSFLFMRAVVKERSASWTTVILAAILGGIPMYIHGYMIIFRGSRLF